MTKPDSIAEDGDMALEVQFAQLLQVHQQLLRQFVATELELATTFYERALVDQAAPGGAHAVRRNMENGRRAYRSAIRAMTRSDYGIDSEPEIFERMQKAQSVLKQ